MHLLKLITFVVAFSMVNTNCLNTIASGKSTKNFLDSIFDKYASNTNTMTLTEFTQLLTKFGIGNMKVKCNKDDADCVKKLHIVKRKKRDLPDAYNTTLHKSHMLSHNKKCLKPQELLKQNEINSSSFGVTREDFVKLCPALIQQIDSDQCVHYHRKSVQTQAVLDHSDTPTRNEVWLYGLLSITVISLLSLAVIAVIPCLKKSYYHKVMGYLVALAVGTLAGDALLHLIPHAFAEGANSAADVVVTEEQKLKQHYSQVYRASFVLLGIYVFFLVEHLMKLNVFCKGTHGHSHGGGGHGHTTNVDVDEKSSLSSPGVDNDEEQPIVYDKNEEKVALQVNGGPSPSTSHASNLHDEKDGGHHHHGEKKITKETKISSLAWMVIVGDGFHNFTDGLAVGVAYSASISSGVSTTIAVFCHELPHELGDFAILINSGMTIKQAIIYNLVSTVLAFFGLIAGILLGGSEMGRHFILSITAGLFLYVSLADMLPELSHQDVSNESKFSIFVCQHLGILSGFTIMLMISLYEHAI